MNGMLTRSLTAATEPDNSSASGMSRDSNWDRG